MTRTRALRILRTNLAEAQAAGDTTREALVRQRLAEWSR